MVLTSGLRHNAAVALRLLAVLVPLVLAPPARADSRYSLDLEAGTEYDSNIHRVDDTQAEAREAAPVLRAGGRLYLAWTRPDVRRRLDLTAVLAGKLYGSESGQDENVLAVALSGRYEQRVLQNSALASFRTNLYDTSHHAPGGHTVMLVPRHFSLAGAEAGLTLPGPDGHRVTVTAGYRLFHYKPDPDVDWRGDHYGASYRTTFWRGDPDLDLDAASVDLTVDYEVERRGYAGAAFANACPPGADIEPMCFAPGTSRRADLHHKAAAELAYTGERIYSVRYELGITDSNSFGQSLVRQRLELGLTTELVAAIFVTTRAAVQLDLFPDTLLLTRDVNNETFTALDDENRNSLSLYAARDVSAAWSIEGRYALFTNELSAQDQRFRRQVVYLGAVYRRRP